MVGFNPSIVLPPDAEFIWRMRRCEQDLLEVERAGRKARSMGLMNGIAMADVAPKRPPSPSFESPSSKRGRPASPALSENHNEGYQSEIVDGPEQPVDQDHNKPEGRTPTPLPAVAPCPPLVQVEPVPVPVPEQPAPTAPSLPAQPTPAPPAPPVQLPPAPPAPPAPPVLTPVPPVPPAPTPLAQRSTAPPAPLIAATPPPEDSNRRKRGPNIDDDVPYVCGWSGCKVEVESRRAWTKHMGDAHSLDHKNWIAGTRCGHPRVRRQAFGGVRTLHRLAETLPLHAPGP
ncbi:hypothetical protein C8Q79DRAFT_128368 [Trametes meyenii]|nr:hypothetical protein C8Q79DRAFT_128368 [Trametes meyenii]